MKQRLLFIQTIFTMFAATPTYSQESDIPPAIPCTNREWNYCELPNLGENCSVGTCNTSLSSSGNCTIEAIYTQDNSAVASCRVCSTEAIDGAACLHLGGSVRSSG